MRNDPEARPSAASPAEQADYERFYEGFFQRESGFAHALLDGIAGDFGGSRGADDS